MSPFKKQAQTGDGSQVHSGSGIVPILKEVQRGELRVIGTGFYIARYGLFATAAHVVSGLQKGVSYVMHIPEPYDGVLHLRRILRVTFFNEVDLAICQADNFVDRFPENPLCNLRCKLSSRIPSPGEELITFAYPENTPLIFNDSEPPPEIQGNHFEGTLIEVLGPNQAPFIPYPHYSTSIQIRSGASGGPVFDNLGFVIGVNCRGWDFDGAEHEGDDLSSVIPVTYLLDMFVELLQLPESSWEHTQIPTEEIRPGYPVRQLVEYGHITFDSAA